MIIERMIKSKILFEVDNKKHVAMYKNFLATGAWGSEGCPFALEFPYLTIPDMIKDKLIHKFLNVKRML